MRALVVTSWRLCSRGAFVGVAAAGIAACSADTTRFGNPNASPYASHSSAPAEYTGATSTVQSAPVGQISAQPLPPPPGHGAMAAAGMGSYNPGPYSAAPAPALAPPPTRSALPPPPAHDVTGSVRSTPNGWSQNGGTAVTVAPGETIDTLASRYGVPASAIMQANNLSGPAALRPGQHIVIPRYNYAAAGAPVSTMPHPAKPPTTVGAAAPIAPAPTASTTAGNVHVVAPGETLMSISRHYHKPLGRIATVNHIPPSTHVKVGDRIVIPGHVAPALRQPAVAAAPTPAVAAPKAQPPARTAQATPAAETTSSARIASTGPQATADAAASGGAPSFRWPLRGRVIAGYGSKPNGQQNDGVDLAVPEGTAVHAAEDGVVAYAGSELKGYGNLILIRHSNGFVTAYAHTSEIMVKRNDTVRRGQVIAKSGQTGTVTSPQLHFEIRKGSSPVDPAQYLPTGT
jgi:murein DD-endopeptidase MepM/ murein hydrolase activator NlpD